MFAKNYTLACPSFDTDPGGYWWPPTYSIWTPTIVSFSFPVSLIVAQFTIFGSFRVLNFRIRFEALNDVFSASNGRENMSLFRTRCLLFMDVVLEEIFLTMLHVSCASNGGSLLKLRPREINVPSYPTGPTF